MPVRTVTLTAGAAMTVDLNGETNAVAVYNRSTTDAVTAALGSVAPVADADDTFHVPAGARRELNWGKVTGHQVRLISPGAAKVEVEWS